MIPEPELDKRVKQGRLLALMFLVVTPLVVLIIACLIKVKKMYPEGTDNFVIYVIFIVAFITPLISIIVKKVQINNYRRNKGKVLNTGPLALEKQYKEMTTGQFFISLLIVQLAFVEATYIYGFMVFLISGELVNILYFYIIGIIWSFIFWPREEKTKNFMKSLEVS